jgi:hypothetical protein
MSKRRVLETYSSSIASLTFCGIIPPRYTPIPFLFVPWDGIEQLAPSTGGTCSVPLVSITDHESVQTLYLHSKRELNVVFPKSEPKRSTNSPSDEGQRAPTLVAKGPPGGTEGSVSPIIGGVVTLKAFETSRAWNQLSTIRYPLEGGTYNNPHHRLRPRPTLHICILLSLTAHLKVNISPQNRHVLFCDHCEQPFAAPCATTTTHLNTKIQAQIPRRHITNIPVPLSLFSSQESSGLQREKNPLTRAISLIYSPRRPLVFRCDQGSSARPLCHSSPSHMAPKGRIAMTHYHVSVG